MARHLIVNLAANPREGTMLKRHPSLTAAVMLAGLCIAAPACATQGYGYRVPTGYERDLQRRAYDSGYRDGVRAGEKDGRKGQSFSYNRHDDWRDADDGYRRDYGDRDFYRRSFRNGFEAGYSESYNRYAPSYGRYPGNRYPGGTNPSYPTYPSRPGGIAVPRAGYSPGAQNGYRDGLEVGRNDARDRNRFDPVRSKRYRDGDHDYDNRYGSRDAYKQDYRSAFQQGYEDGYRGVRR